MFHDIAVASFKLTQDLLYDMHINSVCDVLTHKNVHNIVDKRMVALSVWQPLAIIWDYVHAETRDSWTHMTTWTHISRQKKEKSYSFFYVWWWPASQNNLASTEETIKVIDYLTSCKIINCTKLRIYWRWKLGLP